MIPFRVPNLENMKHSNNGNIIQTFVNTEGNIPNGYFLLSFRKATFLFPIIFLV